MRLRPLLQLRVLVPACSCVIVATLVTGALASLQGQAARPTLELVRLTEKDCPKPKELVGPACADKSGMVFHDKWTVGDKTATWTPPNWQATYRWTVPQTIPPAGATMTLGLTATELTMNPNTRICPAIGVSGGVGFPSGTDGHLLICADSGKTASGSKTVRLLPPSAASGSVELRVGLQDGPRYVYRYRAVATPKRCRKPSRSDRSAVDCRHSVAFVFTQGGRRPKGMPGFIKDVLTAGKGTAEYVDETEDDRKVWGLESATGRVVRTMEIIRPGPAVDEVELVFRVACGATASCTLREFRGKARSLNLDLEVVRSTDEACPATRKSPRAARLEIGDAGGSELTDQIELRVAGCPHHTARFKGSTGPRSAVKVAIGVR